MIRVLNITEEGRGGGALFRIITVSKNISDEVHTIVVGPKDPVDFQNRMKGAGVEFRVMRMYSLSRSPYRLFLYLLNFIPEVISLVRIIRRLRPDIIHVNGSWQFKGILSSWITGKHSIWHLNDTHQSFFVRRLFSIFSVVPRGFIFASQRTKNYYSSLIKKYAEKQSFVIPATISIPDDISARKYPSTKQKWKGLMIGYINRNKGIEHIIEGASALKKSEVDVDIIGPVINTQASYWNTLVELKERNEASNISFLGFKEITKELFQEYDFYICSSNNESSPLAVWQAMAHGLPIVSMDVGDVKNVIDQYQCGVMIESFNSSDLVRAIHDFLDLDCKIKNTMSRSSIQASREIFDIEVVKKEYISMYRSIIGESDN